MPDFRCGLDGLEDAKIGTEVRILVGDDLNATTLEWAYLIFRNGDENRAVVFETPDPPQLSDAQVAREAFPTSRRRNQ